MDRPKPKNSGEKLMDSCATIQNLVLLFMGENCGPTSSYLEKSVERHDKSLSVRDPRCIRRCGG